MPSIPIAPAAPTARRRACALTITLVLTIAAAAAACGGAERPAATLTIGGIPDQDASHLQRQFGLMAAYLEDATGLAVEYVPANDYAAIVSAFRRGDMQLAWFGGLTGVQARAVVDGATAVAQRPRDAEFRSVFIVRAKLDVQSLAGVAGHSLTFGPPSSTSGHLMPRFFLAAAGVDADADLDGLPGFSNSHDATYKLIEAGSYELGALNEAVWDRAVATGAVDTTKVRVLLRTPAYFDYQWSIRPDVDARLGAGTHEAIVRALLDLDASLGDDAAELLELFQARGFVPTRNANYDAIEAVARALGIVR